MNFDDISRALPALHTNGVDCLSATLQSHWIRFILSHTTIIVLRSLGGSYVVRFRMRNWERIARQVGRACRRFQQLEDGHISECWIDQLGVTKAVKLQMDHIVIR